MSLMDSEMSARARFNMVECQIKPGGVRDYRLTRQLLGVPREAFVGGQNREIAYADCSLDYARGDVSRTILAPLAFARLAELADIEPGDVILNIAGGSGYAAAVMAGLASTVISLEDDEAMSEKASDNWRKLEIDNAVAVTGPLPEGQPKQGPFNIIFINGCVAEIPEDLLAQLDDGGRLVCVQNVEGSQKAIIYRRIGDSFARLIAFDLTVPVLDAFDPVPVFEF